MATTKQDIIYLEADEDITSAIDKLNKSHAPSVAIVAPKRSTLIQSLINLRLLKKASDDAGRFLVLVTGDRTATHLAGRLGIDVATTLGGKAGVPTIVGEAPRDETEVIDEDAAEPTAAEVAAMSAAIPAAAVATPSLRALAAVPLDEPTGTGELDGVDEEPEDEPDIRSTSLATPDPVKPMPVVAPKPLGHGLSTRVPNFSTMQKRLLWGGGILAAILLIWVVNVWVAHANVRIYARGDAIQNDFAFTIDPVAKASDPARSVIVGQLITTSRDATATLTATGQKDAGTKASGTVSVKNCEDTSSHNLPVGTQFKNGDKVFSSTGAATVPGGAFSGGGTVCTSGTVVIAVIASANGDGYNLAAGTYTSPALTANYKVNGSQMAGGTTKNITVVAQTDIDKAKADALAKDRDAAKTEALAKTAAGYATIDSTFVQTPGEVTASPALDAEGSTGTVTVHMTYTILAYNKADLASLATTTLAKKAPADAQVYDDGAADSKLTTITAGYQYSAQAYVGTRIDTDKITKAITGKRYGDAIDYMNKLPGVEKVEVDLTPRWITSLPVFGSHINLTLKVAPKG